MTTPTTLTPAAPTRKPASCDGCSLASTGKGFCLGAGAVGSVRLMIVLETPSNNELGYFLRTDNLNVLAEGELARRRARYPELAEEFMDRGVPVVGPTGSVLNNWILPKVGIRRQDIFLDNTLRCLVPANKKKQHYPTGRDRNIAELKCRQYDRVAEFAPDVVLVTMHPACILREMTPLPLIIKDMEKAVAFTRQGYKVMVVMGGFAAEAYLGYASNVSKWRGHYQVMVGESARWLARVTARLTKRAERGAGKGKRVSKAEQLRRGGAMGDIGGDVFDQALGWSPSVKARKACVAKVAKPPKVRAACKCGCAFLAHDTAPPHACKSFHDYIGACGCEAYKAVRKPRAKSATQLAKALGQECLVNLRENVAADKAERNYVFPIVQITREELAREYPPAEVHDPHICHTCHRPIAGLYRERVVKGEVVWECDGGVGVDDSGCVTP